MTQEQLTAFLAEVKGNTNLQEQLKTATDAVAAIAKEAGLNISAEHLKNAQPIELSDQELAHLAGGGRGRMRNWNVSRNWKAWLGGATE